MLAELGHLKTIIGRFSDFAKMPAPQLEPVDVNQVAREVMQLFDAQLRAPGQPPVEIKLQLDADPGEVPADPDQLRRALRNLVLNALDAMPQGGTLTVRTSRHDNKVALEVSDTGEGLTPEECDRLFTPYYTTKQHGTGLGLAIVQSVVSDHKGTITVHSEPGKGHDISHRVDDMSKLLLVDDDANTLASLARAFRLAGHEAVVCDQADRALELAKAQRFDVILSDVVMPGKDGLTLLAELKAAGVAAPVVMISGQASIEMAVRATRLGAVDFLEKPLSTEKLLVTVENTVKLARLEDENKRLRQRAGKQELIWKSAVMQSVMAKVERVAASETRVAILGETGAGKELIARTLHEKSQRRNGPFITLNCAAVPAELIESELFGHEKGAFTGAATRHTGKFEQAHGGTLFLDEIGDMPPMMQAKLLRVLEQKEVERDWRRPAHRRGRARDRGHAPQSGRTGAQGRVSAGSISSRFCFPDCAASAARAPRGYPAAGGFLRAGRRGTE